MKNNIKALDKVERVYYIELPDGKIQFNPDNGIEFIKAVMKDFIYKKCKKDFYSNPKIVFAPKSFSEKVVNGGASYNTMRNCIIIDTETLIERAYHKYYDSSYTEESMNRVIELNLFEVLIHELNHSMEFRMHKKYSTDEKVKAVSESQNEYDALPRFFRRRDKEISKYLGYSPYGNMNLCIFEKDTLDKMRDVLAKTYERINFDEYSDKSIAAAFVLEYNTSKQRYKKASIISHFFKEILGNDIEARHRQIKFVKDSVFKDGYSVTIAIPEAQNSIRSEDDELSFTFNKLDFTNPTRYMRKAQKVAEHMAAYNYIYSNITYGYEVTVEVNDKDKNILIMNTYLAYSNAWNAIQYK